MLKSLFEVFKGLELNSELNGYFQEAKVSEIVMDKQIGVVGITVVLNNIVHPKFIHELEKVIYELLGEPNTLQVVVNEVYQLPFDIPFKDLFILYKEPLLAYIREINPLCVAAIHQGNINVLESSLVIEVPKAGLSYIQENLIEEFVIEIFKSKFEKVIDVEVLLKTDDRNRVFEEFIRNRDIEQKNILRQQSRAVSHEIKVTVKEEDITKEIYDNLIYGKKPAIGDVIKIKDFDEDTKFANVDVEIISKPEDRELRGGKFIMKFDVTDYTDSITCKMFVEKEDIKIVKKKIKKGAILRIRGQYRYDDYDHARIFFVTSIEVIDCNLRVKRIDNAKEKRVELHFHTQMSDMDAVVSPKDAIKQAIAWGHKAIAITDHGVVQAFPEAFHEVPNKETKIIYGVEAYFVDDTKPIVTFPKGQDFKGTFIVFDIETTGFRAHKDKFTEIGAVKIVDGVIKDKFSEFINPGVPIPPHITDITSITNEMVKNAPPIEVVLPKFIEFCEEGVLVAQNAEFDMSYIIHACKVQNIEQKFTYVDTLEIARRLFPDLKNYRLNTIADALEVRLTQHHRAVYDAQATADILIKMFILLDAKGIVDLDGLIQYGKDVLPNFKKLRMTHGVILCKTRQGLLNLYRLISKSHIETFYRRPRILKSYFDQYREGLIVGSACEASDLYPAVLEGKSEEVLDRIIQFYDYLEIQPTGNNAFLVENGKVDSLKEIEEVNQRICELGKQYNKLVVATCDVHFLNPEDEVYRRIIMAGKGFKDADNQAPLYYRTTNEMLNEFTYLGEEKAYEVVVTNTNKIADSLDYLEPVEPGKYAPKIPNSDEDLRNMCYKTAHDIYGEELPYIVQERLDRELDSIINNGFAVMYIIAHKLVKKSNEEGYLVGSRGSVGSSFAATMSGITEVNPLSPHYICEKCRFSDFDSDEVKAYAGSSGVDMPDKLCPNCGHPLTKEGHDIPFETFLGFKGNKEPDIDLNFSGDYQAEAHKYTGVIFGEENVFKAGTIGTLAEKTAYGYVKGYFKDREIEVKEAEINRIIQGCVGVRRTTGQHPGGIIVLPEEEEIYKFTPIQRPANDQKSDIITTHFDYHSIDHNLLKLDILGHDDPTMIRYLEDLTGVEATKIPLDEPKVMSLFTSADVLNLDIDELDDVVLGSLGIPEFGTKFVMQMLLETKPQTFSDLIRISGLSHGTDVWTNNAQKLVKEGKATISTCISTRDDIMTYLINQGMDKELSFTIMEATRKGKGLEAKWEAEMIKHGVPSWYIWSCNTIKYMFPKAHAAAYVMMAYRIAYFKVYYPLEYYSAFFSIRASNFDYDIMCHGKERLNTCMRDYKQRLKEITKKEQDMIKDMQIVQEMYARGYEFLPIDIYEVEAKYFRIIDGKIMPSLLSINGMGEKAANGIVEGRVAGEFISIEDFRIRTKTGKTLIELLKEHEILKGLPETNQISLF